MWTEAPWGPNAKFSTQAPHTLGSTLLPTLGKQSQSRQSTFRKDQKNLVSKNPHQSTLQKLGKCPKKALNLLCRIHTAPPGHCNQSCPPDTQIQEIKLFNQIFPLHNRPFLYGCVIPQTLLPLNDRFWPKALPGTQKLMHFHTKVIRHIARQASAVALTSSLKKYC